MKSLNMLSNSANTSSIPLSPSIFLTLPIPSYFVTMGMVSLRKVAKRLRKASILSSFLPEVLLLSKILCIMVSSSASTKTTKGMSTESPRTRSQPSKLSWLRGKPSIRKRFEDQPCFSMPRFKSWQVISTGTILPSTMHWLIRAAVSEPESRYKGGEIPQLATRGCSKLTSSRRRSPADKWAKPCFSTIMAH